MKTTVTAIFPGGIGEVEISRERADQILRLQKIIRKQRDKNSIGITSLPNNLPLGTKIKLRDGEVYQYQVENKTGKIDITDAPNLIII